MDITPSLAADRQVIQSYGPEGFRIGGAVYRHPVLVWPDHVERWEINIQPPSSRGLTTGPSGADGLGPAIKSRDDELGSVLSLETFGRIMAYEPKAEFILLGCGSRGMFLSPALKQALRDAGLGIDAMDTGAACRTFNIMLTEERPVVAAIMVG